jgi:4-amino-4-deoxy-L-arabinose transferase-like glycosyltransferase
MAFEDWMTGATPGKWLAACCIVLVYLGFTLYRLGFPDLSPDEGRYGLVAVNILSDHRQLAVLSEDPLGGPGSKPFAYAVSLASSIVLLGKNEFALRAVSVVALLGAGSILFGLVDLCFRDQCLAALSLFFFLLNPWTISYARTAMPEPILVFWGCLGVFAAASFFKSQRLIWAFACGLGLGFAFLTKLWLALPFAAASSVFFIAAWASFPTQQTAAGIFISCLAFLLACASHLVLVLRWAPADFSHWLQLYFIESFSSRAGGAGHDPAMWFRPWWFYLAGLFKATFFSLPVAFLAIFALIRRRQLGLLAVVAAMLSPFLVLSLFVVKQTSYAYPAFPAVAFLLAYGTLTIIENPSRQVLIVSTLLSVTAALLFLVLGTITRAEFVVISGLYLLYMAASFTTKKYRAASVVAGPVLAAMLAADILTVRVSLQHRTYYRELATCLRPLVTASAPQAVIFQAPEYPSLEFYLFRTGEYWRTYYFHESYGAFLNDLIQGKKAFYVVDPTGTLYGSKVSPAQLHALHVYATDETSQVERAMGRKIGLQIFLSSAWGPRY